MRKGEQPPWIVPDELWARIQPLLPVVPRRADHPGRKRLDDRKVLSGILFVLYTGIAWEFLPQELGFGSGMTCWRRLRDWHAAGVWQKLHELLLAELHAAGRLDWSKAVMDSPRPGAEGRPKTGPSPVDRAKTGSKHHVIADGNGIPLALSLTGGNRNDVTQVMPLLRSIPPVRGRRGRPRRRPKMLYADRGYDHDKYRRMVWATGVKPVIARRGTEHGSGLGVHRWVIEQTIALLHWFRRLRIRWEIRDDIHEAFMTLAAAIICWRRLIR
ncbi:IS5 family transposase [Nonomuraea phyllanthi]|uniref:IS5 family transposase n=1 Tax=Nonomuraea phyllanthi TaxID=2219224 RepID=A0A5C4UUP4_9ACTN|nr:IS5 family transposase [Nonomuraea phyllanthi]